MRKSSFFERREKSAYTSSISFPLKNNKNKYRENPSIAFYKDHDFPLEEAITIKR